jgi:two-component system, cell cycle sensor histidine kinase and response regulator CckA
MPVELELAELRAREAEYRARLADALERSKRLREQTGVLLDIWRQRPPRAGDLISTLTAVAHVSGRALSVLRTSVWHLDTDQRQLHCSLLISGDRVEPYPGRSLSVTTSPAYFSALRESGVLAIENAPEDPRCVGLEEYLRAHGVGALLDIAISAPGGPGGVVCHEHVGGRRVWKAEEIDFALHVSNLVSLAFEVERRQSAEAKAISAEARYRYLVESLPVTVYSFAPRSQTVEYLGPQFAELGLLSPEEVSSRGVAGWVELVHPDDRWQVLARFAPHGVDAQPREIQYRLALPGGSVRYIRDQCRVVRNHAGDAVAVQGVLADVTEMRKTEERVIELERRMRSMLEHVELFAVVLDADGSIEYANACFERSTGHARARIVSRNFFDLCLPPEERAGAHELYTRQIQRDELPARGENEILTETGERRRVVWTYTLLRGENGSLGCCCLGLDITERARQEAEQLQRTKLESLGQLSAGVAHDFNNLLAVLNIQASALAERSDPSTAETLAVMRQSLDHASQLTRSLMTYARQDSVSPRPVVVDRLVEDSMPLLAAVANREVELTHALGAADAAVKIDPSQLRQVLMNLVSNAVDATRGHGRCVHIRTSIELVSDATADAHGIERGRQYVVLGFVDDGRGMDKPTLSRIFEPFFTTKAPGKGTGLGMAMCASIVRRAEGAIVVESVPGGGAACRVLLPMLDVVLPSGGANRAPVIVVPPHSPANTPVVLLVEDQDALRRLVERALRALPVKVRAVATFAEASSIMANENVDLLVTDGTLPDGSGRLLARTARAARSSLRVLLVSGALDRSEEFDACLLKPFELKVLVSTVTRLLHLRSE